MIFPYFQSQAEAIIIPGLHKKLKIALVANSTWNIYNFRLNIIEKLLNAGFDVIVVAPIDAYVTYRNKFPTVKHIAVKELARKGTNPIQDLKLLLEFRQIFRREQPDLILHYTVKPNIYGGIAARLTHSNYIGVITGLGYTFLHNGLIYKITKILYRLSFKNAAKVVFENIDDRILFNGLGITTSEKSVSLKGCGINTEHFKLNIVPTNDNRHRVFSFIGRFLYDKGIKEFVEAARIVKEKHPNTQFWLIGSIDTQNPSAIDESELQAWIEKGIVIYKGQVEDVRPFIAQSDCIVCPSYREAIARVLQEGMAMEKAVITTDVAGCREAVEEGKNGYIVKVKDPKNLADAMFRIIEMSHNDLIKLGKYGRKKVEKEFDDRIIARQFLEIINEALGITTSNESNDLKSKLPHKIPAYSEEIRE